MCYCAFLGYPHLGNITRGPMGISGTEEGTHIANQKGAATQSPVQ